MSISLRPEGAWALVQGGAVALVDLRSPEAFAQAHPKVALNLPYSPKGLEARLSVVLQRGTSVVLLASEPEQAAAAAAQLAGGRFPVAGIVEDGMAAWQSAGLPAEPLPTVSIQELVKLRLSAEAVILDVREPMEWETGHVPGASLIALGNLRHRLDELPKQAHIAVICESGLRSSTAASLLQARGFAHVANVLDGTAGYRRAGLPLGYPAESVREA